jgi:hypothetical protein
MGLLRDLLRPFKLMDNRVSATRDYLSASLTILYRKIRKLSIILYIILSIIILSIAGRAKSSVTFNMMQSTF